MLTLPIKAKWYDMILAGEKGEEYRAASHYYAVRFQPHKDKPVRIRLRNGYRRDSRTLECVVIPRLRYGARPEWGGVPSVCCWVLEVQTGTVKEIGAALSVRCADSVSASPRSAMDACHRQASPPRGEPKGAGGQWSPLRKGT